jgi:hypothetical protein
MPYSVYLGDTSSELEDLRPIVIDQIKLAGMTLVEMTGADRQKPNMPDVVRQKIQGADYFITIVTYKRAWEPGNQGGKSLAELEYEIALEAGKPLAVLLPQDKSEMGMFLRVRSLGQKPADALRQQQFWKRLAASGKATYFADEADLIQRIAQMLSIWGGGAERASVPLTPPGEQTLFPANASDIDRLAQKVAERVDSIQQRREKDLAAQAVKVNEALRLKPGELVFGLPSTGKQFQSDIFMIMPFAEAFRGLYVDIVKPLTGELKLTITRGDEFNSSRGVIMEEVWAALNACRFVIAEISGGNDNVFYELGIAHTLNKPAILITQSAAEDIPFDVRHLRYIRYENTVAGGAKLREDLKTAITRLLSDLDESWSTPSGA